MLIKASLKLLVLAIVHFLSSLTAPLLAATPDWSDAALINVEGRPNIFEQSAEAWPSSRHRGQIHSLSYPVSVTGVLIPKELMVKTLIAPYDNFLWKLLLGAFKGLTGFRSFDDVEKFVGLVPIADDAHNLYKIPLPPTQGMSQRYGTSFLETDLGTGITFSCASCHVSQLFGVPIYGLQNRFPRANEFFIAGKKGLSIVEPHIAAFAVGASADTGRLLKRSKEAMGRLEARLPLIDGLDTSLAHVALSLSRRNKDEYASFSGIKELFPDPEILREQPSDSKPGTWWNLKYKNKWLSDGSVVSGNPIFTNILWNELGRGTDLRELEVWLDNNEKSIKDLTTAVFAAEAPRYTDFFRADAIALDRAQRGQVLFEANCSRCHGHYEKAWDKDNALELPREELLATVRVRYFENTPVVDVGTDPWRREGMRSLLQLNDLAISQKHDVKVRVQKGYVPPPLLGIWARWPYFHNNAVPTLCAVLTKGSERPKTYFAGEAIDPATDFDAECNGYPSLAKAPSQWKSMARRLYDTSRAGMSNKGHDEGIFLRDGKELYSRDEKRDIVEFLKTL